MITPRPAAGMVTLASIARRLNRSPQTILRWVERGEFPRPVLLNGRRYLLEDQVAAWFDQTYASTSLSNDVARC